MIELSPELQQFVQQEVAAGAFSDANAVIEAAVEHYRQSKQLTPTEDYSDTVRELTEAVADMEAGNGRTIEEVDASIRSRLGLGAPS